MLAYILRRFFIAIGTVWVISVVSFAIIQLPPGDYVTSYIAQLMSTGTMVTQEEAANLRAQYGLDQPIYVQYAKWMWQVLQGNFGVSMEWKRPVTEGIGDRLLLTALLAFTAVIFT
jgi:peptide/nickel transport system permease protein